MRFVIIAALGAIAFARPVWAQQYLVTPNGSIVGSFGSYPIVNGAPVSSSNPLPVTGGGGGGGAAGTLGIDASANAPALNGNVLGTCTSVRGFIAQNQSAVTIQEVLDDTAGTTTPTILLLGPNSTAGTQGASSDTIPFAGRVRIEGTAGSQIALRCW